MDFFLPVPFVPFKEKINYRQSLLFIGSCFAENIGERMEKYKFKTFTNPNGIVYNPSSIAIALRNISLNKKIKKDELFFANEHWNSWEHHSYYSHPNKGLMPQSINEDTLAAYQILKNGDWLSITFGSAFYYKRKDSGRIVANCHKQAQKEFTKHLLNVDEIVKEYSDLFEQLKILNTNLKVVFTISPVRYIRDGIVENNRSKAILIEAVHRLKEQHENVFYFPAYDLVMDSLRDYRFFKEDLVHPTEQAIEYVFEKFAETIFDAETKNIFERIKEINTAFNHRPLHSTSTMAHQKFIETYKNKAKQLQAEFPFLNLNTD